MRFVTSVNPTLQIKLLATVSPQNEVIMVVHDNRPGTLSGLAKKLASEGINIEYAYLANEPDSPKGLLIFRPNDINKAFDVLRRS